MCPPEPVVGDNLSVRSRWSLLRDLVQSFWKIWHREILNTKMQRQKWQKATPNLQVGQLVYIPDTKCSPSSWPMGIVENVFQGSQNSVRIVQIRTTSGLIQRSTNKLIVIPVDQQ